MATDLVFLTGGTGFIGSHVACELLTSGYRVRALTRGSGRVEGCETVTGDLCRTGELARWLSGCRYVVHCGSLYSFASRDRVRMQRVNVDGTAGLLAAAHIAGVERAVLTASAGIGQSSFYHRSKLQQERAALASRVPVVALLPTAPVGPGDWKPTPTGRMVLDFARGKMFAKPPAGGGMNLVAVEDVARAHVTALERGITGERYIIGGENLSFDRIWELLADASGRTVPRWHAPRALALTVGWIDELRCRLNPAATPFAPLEGVRLSSKEIYADSTQAQRAFGYQSQPVYGALERAVAWYSANGYVS